MPGPLTAPTWLDHYRDRTVVVTGAGGFLGGRLVARLAATPCHLVRVSRSTLAPLDPRHPATTVDVIGDVRDAAIWARVVGGADVVVHFAAQTSAAVADENPALDFDANVTPMSHLLRACRRLRCSPTILFAGTVTQAGVQARLPVDEDATDVPVTAYDQHKLMAERELERAVSAGVVPGVTLRLPNIYGPGSADTSRDRDVLNRMIQAALRGETLKVFGSGDYLRDYLFVDDAVDAFLVAGAHAGQISGRHFVIGSGSGVTIRDAFELIAVRVEARTGRRVPVVRAEPGRPLTGIEQRSFVANPARFIAATGWQRAWTLCDGIDRTIESFTCE